MRRAPLAGFTGVPWNPDVTSVLMDRRRRKAGLRFTEIPGGLAPQDLPAPLVELSDNGVSVVPAAKEMCLDTRCFPGRDHITHLADLADAVSAPLVTGRIMIKGTSGQPTVSIPRTEESLDAVVENIRIAQDRLGRPLAAEIRLTPDRWDRDDLPEGPFLTSLTSRTGCWIVLDLTRVAQFGVDHDHDPVDMLEGFPFSRVAYYRVTSSTTQPLSSSVLDVVARLSADPDSARTPILLESTRPVIAQLNELDRLTRVLRRLPAAAPHVAPALPGTPLRLQTTALAGG